MLERKYPWQLTVEEMPYYEQVIELAVGIDQETLDNPLISEGDLVVKDKEQAINIVSNYILSELMQLWTWNLPEGDSIGVWVTQVIHHMNGTKTLSCEGLAGRNVFIHTNQIAEDQLIEARKMGCVGVMTFVSESRYEAFVKHNMPHRPVSRYVSLEPIYTSD